MVEVETKVGYVLEMKKCKRRKKCAPMAQTIQNDSFGLVLLTAATFFHSGLVIGCLCSYFNERNTKV